MIVIRNRIRGVTMQLYDYSSFLSVNGVDTSSYYDSLETNDTTQIDSTEQFESVLKNYISKDYITELNQKALEVESTQEGETNSNYLSDLSESMMSTSSGRKVIASMIENQIMGIVTGNVDEDSNDTLQSLLLGTEGENTLSSIEETLLSLQTDEKTKETEQ